VSDQRYEIELVARVEALEKGLNEAVSHLQRLGGVAEGVRHQLGSKLADAAIAGLKAIPQGVSAAVSSMLELADEMSNLSEATGLSVATLQEFRFAGDAVGVEAERIAQAVTKLQIQVVKGSGETAEALGRLGLSGKQLKGMLPDDALSAVLGRLKDVGHEAERNALAFELLGMAGPKIAPLADGLEQAREKARSLGVVMSQESIQAADALGDSMGELRMTAGGLVNRLGDVVTSSQAMHTFIEGVAQIVAQFSQGVGENKDALQGLVTLGVNVAAKALSFFLTVVVGVIEVVKVTVVGIKGWQVALLDLAAGYYRAKAAVQEFFGKGEAAQQSRDMADSLKFQADLVKAGQEQIKSFEGVQDTVAQAALAIFDLSNNLGKGSVEMTKAGDGARRTTSSVKTLSEEAKRAAEEMSRLGESLDRALADAEAEGLGGIAGEFHRIGAEATEQMNAIRKAMAHGFDAGAAEELTRKVGMLQQKLKDVAIGRLGKSLDQALVEAAGKGLGELAGEFHRIGTEATQQMSAIRAAMAYGLDARAAEELARKVSVLQQRLEDVAIQGARQRVIGETFSDVRTQAESVVQVLALWQQRGEDIGDLTDAGLRSFEQSLSALVKTSEGVSGLSEALERVREELAQRTRAAFLHAFQDPLTYIKAVPAALQAIGGEAARVGAAVQDAFGSIDQLFKTPLSDIGGLISGVTGVVAAFRKATDSASGGLRALGGAAMGAKLGAQFGGAWGAAIGAAVGAVAGIFAKPSWVKVGEEAGRVLGMKVSKEFAQEIERTSKDLRIDVEAATLLHLGEAMEHSGRDAREFASQVSSLMEGIAQGAIPARQGLEELGDAFGAVREAAQEAGTVGDRALVGILQQARQLGGAFYTPEMRSFVEEKLDLAIDGLRTLIGTMTEIPDSFQGKDAGLTLLGGDAEAMRQNAADQATIFMATFGAVLSERGMVGAVDALGPMFDTLREKLDILGETVGTGTADAILAPFARLRELMGNDLFRGAAESAEAGRKILVGLADAGYLDIETFRALERQALHSFGVMVDQGATPQEALSALAPTIQAAISAAEQFGVPLSADMEKLKQMAEAQGIAFQTSPMERVVQVLEAIAVKLGADLPVAASQAAQSISLAATQSTGAWQSTSATLEGGVIALGGTAEAVSATMSGCFVRAGELSSSAVDAAVGNMTSSLDQYREESELAAQFVQQVWVGQMGELPVHLSRLRPQVELGFNELAEAADPGLRKVAGRLGAILGTLEDIPDAARSAGDSLGGMRGPGEGRPESGAYQHSAQSGFYSPSMPVGPHQGGASGLLVHPREEVIVSPAGSGIGAQVGAAVAHALAGILPARGGAQTIVIQIGGEVLKRVIETGTKNGTIRVHADAVREF